MRCIGCGHEMRLVKAVADCTMMVPGYEHQTLECPGCRTVERRMVFGRTIGPLTVEPMRLSSGALAAAADPKQNDRVDPPKTSSLKTYSEKTHSENTHSEKTYSENWARALDRLRSTQSALKERAAAAMASETIHELYRTWDGLMPGRRTEMADRSSTGTPSGSRQKPRGTSERAIASEAPKPAATRLAPAQRPTVSHRPTAASMSGKAEPGAAPMSALAQVAAKLRSRQAMLHTGVAAEARPLQGQTFDQVWDGVRSSPGRPTPAVTPSMPRPGPLMRSHSLVALEVHPEVASSLWARAVAMLRGRHG